VIELIHRFQDECFTKHGTHFVHASDEWYILAGMELPKEERYDGYLQLENGVGMLRLLQQEFEEAFAEAVSGQESRGQEHCELSMATGLLAYPYISRMAKRMEEAFPWLSIYVYPINNEFFGKHITVSGLLTGQDLKAQLTGQKLGSRLLLPQNVLRSGENYFLDDITIEDLEKALQVPINIVKSSGYDFVHSVLTSGQDGVYDC
ncbi:MAG: DUF512 domain-containing protein, partial [Lachnospiraceae bacterium]|nr:DUF512 domain-containing protein [Lachnospiraceae bacterium]